MTDFVDYDSFLEQNLPSPVFSLYLLNPSHKLEVCLPFSNSYSTAFLCLTQSPH